MVNRQQARELTERAMAALEAAMSGTGVEIHHKGTRYGETVTLRIELRPPGSESPEAQAFRRDARWWGLKAEDLGRQFQAQGKTHTIIGLKPRARRRPILTESGGKRYMFPAERVVALLVTQGVRADG